MSFRLGRSHALMQARASDRRCLLLDAMGTLVWLRPPAPRLRIELARRFGIEISLDEAEQAIAAEIRYYRAHMQDGRDGPSVRALRARCAEALRSALPGGERLDGVDGAGMTAALLASLEFSVFDDAPGALQAAAARRWPVVVVSNWDQSLSEVLGRLGLAPLLDRVVTSAAAGAGKPDPAIFEFALEAVGATAEHALHVGDSLEEDVAGARAAGIRARVAQPPRWPDRRRAGWRCHDLQPGRARRAAVTPGPPP